MVFQFTRLDRPVIATVVYDLPDMPIGTSRKLLELIETYAEAIRNGPDDAVLEPYEAVSKFAALSISDIIAKALVGVHFDHQGIDGDRLVLALTERDEPSVRKCESILADLYAQLPQDWDSALRCYRATLLAEYDYDRRVWNPGYEAEKNGGEGNSAAVEDEMERLQDIRCDAEDFLLQMPAPSLAEFAIKYLICFDSGRDHNGWHEELCAEAKRLLQVEDSSDATELETMLANLNWRAA